MAKQKGSSQPVFSDLRAVDNALKRIGELDRETTEIETQKNSEIDKAKSTALTLSAPIVEEKKNLVLNLKDYCEFNKEQFLKQRSKKMNWGTVGFRLSPSALKTLARWTWDKVLAKLRESARRDFIAVKESVDKEAVRKAKLNPEDLAILGMKMESKEEFWFEINQDELKDTEEKVATQRTVK